MIACKIAWLKDQVPPTTKFNLSYSTIHESTINVVDPTFNKERVIWIGLRRDGARPKCRQLDSCDTKESQTHGSVP